MLEFPRVTEAIAAAAVCARARARLLAWRPIAASDLREAEIARLAEAIRRQREPGEWCFAPEGGLAERLEREREEPLDGLGLRDVLGWLEAARATRDAWDDDAAARFPGLAGRVTELPQLETLRLAIANAIEPDGRVSDAASPALRRARADLAGGERDLERRLTRWVQPFGENAYVTRHGERFVVLVPAAGFSRRRGIVHDVSGSGQSLFVEPLEACESNNRLLELRATVSEEERRIVRELAAQVMAERERLERLEDTLADLDTLRARARWAGSVGAIAIAPGGDRLKLERARHPLLAMSRGDQVIPLDLELTGEHRLLLVSGPNMGGTVLLKTVGLAAALAHAALPVPAGEGSAVPELDVLEVDLGDEQSVDQGLSTFAAHLRSLRTMADEAGPRSLLLCDELGAGTDPDEGAALGRALLERFSARGAWGVVTTHLGSLKRVAGEVPGVVNGSLEFDEATFTSRYRFIPGIPGASHALAVMGASRVSARRARARRTLTPVGAHGRAAARRTAGPRAGGRGAPKPDRRPRPCRHRGRAASRSG